MNKIQIYLHGRSNSTPKLVEISEDPTIHELIYCYIEEFQDSGKSEEILVFVEDEEEPINPDNHGSEHGIAKRSHIHFHRCRKVSVSAIYNHETKTFSVSPSTTVKKLKKLILDKFNIKESDSGDLLLKLENGSVLQPADHVGSFSSFPDCEVKLFLTAAKPIQG